MGDQLSLDFPYTDDRLIGTVHQVDGAAATLSLPRARHLPGSSDGERLGLGEVGEFVIVDVGGDGVFARILELRSPDPNYSLETKGADEESKRASGHAQLLCTIRRDGSYLRGIARHPRVGDKVYTASQQLVANVIAGINKSGDATEGPMLALGTLGSYAGR